MGKKKLMPYQKKYLDSILKNTTRREFPQIVFNNGSTFTLKGDEGKNKLVGLSGTLIMFYEYEKFEEKKDKE